MKRREAIIELEINSKSEDIDLNTNNEVDNLMKKLEIVISYMGKETFQDDKIALNYYNQPMYITKEITKEMEKAEDEIFRMLKTEGGIDIENDDYKNISLKSIINDNLANKFANANNMSEINNQTLNNCKKEIIDFFNIELDKYAKSYMLNDKLLYNLKEDMGKIVSQHFDKITKRLLNNNARDKLDNLCNELDEEYKKCNFSKMIEITEDISEYFSKNEVIYRDDVLFDKLRINMSKSKMVQSKLENGKEGILNKDEEDLILKFDKEQIEKLNNYYKGEDGISKEDISMTRFEIETNIIKQILGKYEVNSIK